MRSALYLLLGFVVAACGSTAETRDGSPAMDATNDAIPDAMISPDSGEAPKDSGVEEAACTGKMGATGDVDRTLDVNGTMRQVVIHVPQSYQASAATPVVIALHGFTETGASFRTTTHFDTVGDMKGWITAFPDGITNSWNGGVCCGVASGTNVDDVGFIRALVKSLASDWCIDPKRVHVAGFSNGGFMAHRLACEASDIVASIGVVAGQVGIPSCTPKRAVPVAQAHGANDPVVPYNGNPFLFYPPTMDTMKGWAMRDACGTSPTQYATMGNGTCVKWPSCAPGADVALCTVAGGTHEWFTGPNFDATGFLADFFEKHPML